MQTIPIKWISNQNFLGSLPIPKEKDEGKNGSGWWWLFCFDQIPKSLIFSFIYWELFAYCLQSFPSLGISFSFLDHLPDYQQFHTLVPALGPQWAFGWAHLHSFLDTTQPLWSLYFLLLNNVGDTSLHWVIAPNRKHLINCRGFSFYSGILSLS